MKMKKNYLFFAFIALAMGLSFSSCSKSDDNTPTFKGTDPNSIATSNLIAYFKVY